MAGATEPGPAGGGEFRFAGAVPAGRKLAKLCPGQRGRLSHRGGWAQGSSARKPEPVVSWHGVQPAASDPHGLEGRPALTRCGVTPDAGLTRPCRAGWSFSAARVGEGGFGPRRAERDGTAQGLRDALREGGPASRPEGAGIPCRWGAGERAKPHSSNHHGPFACAPQVRTSSGHRECSHAAGEVFARGVLAWDGGAGKGRSVEIAPHADLPRKRGRTRSGTSCANRKPRKRLRLRGLDVWQ
jgi:hypothetical protein